MRRRCWVPALVTLVLGFSWQLLTVHFNYGGNFTALFCTGSEWPVPPALAGEHVYVFPHSPGYDGQEYHYIAHDPLYSNGMGRFVDAPGSRYRRILLPGLSYALALGRQDWVDGAYIACNLAFLGLGAWFVAQLLARSGRNCWFAVLYLLVPATLISLDRLTVDMALTSLALGFALYVDSGERRKLYVILLLAALCRDTGFLLTLAVLVPLAFRRRFREALVWSTALVPAIAWNLWVTWRIPQSIAFASGKLVPFSGWIEPILHPPVYHLSAVVAVMVRGLDWLQLLGFLLAFVAGLGQWRKAKDSSVSAACVLWGAMGILLPALWQEDPYVARLFSPLLVWQFLGGRRTPLLTVAPRPLVQLVPQVMGILRGMLGI